MIKAIATATFAAALTIAAVQVSFAQGGGGGGPANSDRGGQGAGSAMGARNTGTPSSTGLPERQSHMRMGHMKNRRMMKRHRKMHHM